MKNELLVKDVMWKDVDIVDRNLSVQDGLDTMQHKKTKMLIVDKAHENDEYGVVLIADIAGKVIYRNASISNEKNEVSLGKLEGGTYYVTIENDTSKSTRKMVVK
mgnify:CR=1 FL=1